MNAPDAPLYPADNCRLCPRLATFRDTNREANPDWHNGPVASFSGKDEKLLIVGLAPGLRGANRTGRPFTGDYAGDLLYPTLLKYKLASGVFKASPDDGLKLINCRITNAVRCVPPQNKPTGAEIKSCRTFLAREIDSLKNLKVILALGRVAHDSVLAALGEKRSAWPFGHGAIHRLDSGLIFTDSYHCSRYNTNTGRLTESMFHAVFEQALPLIRD
ncbi:MAG: uracil-DNA glycosylase [Rhodospirillales bacterium]|nr:uracil-DNA glycosylase [Rhodospirillales bacterium]